MMKFQFDVHAIATVELRAVDEDAARDILFRYQGARFETRAIAGESDDYREIELIHLSTRARAALIESSLDGEEVAQEVEVLPDPDEQALLPDGIRQELEVRLAAWEAAADSATGDEHAAAAELVDVIRAMLRPAYGETA